MWSSALYIVPHDFLPGDPLGRPIAMFRPKRAGWPGALHTLADPFLFVRGDRLYLFMEAQRARSPGVITCRSTADLDHFEDEGTVLEGPGHLSYPCVFAWGGEIYMIPESAEAGEVALYRFRDFPRGLEKLRVLLRGAYVDSSVLVQDDIVYLFTTSAAGLHLFSMRDPITDTPRPHGQDPLPVEPALARCGGAPIRAGGQVFRLAQYGLTYYGEGLSACNIKKLAIDDYKEETTSSDILGDRRGWNSRGGHHMSIAYFRGRTLVAVDGQADEPLWTWTAKQPVKWLMHLRPRKAA